MWLLGAFHGRYLDIIPKSWYDKYISVTSILFWPSFFLLIRQCKVSESLGLSAFVAFCIASPLSLNIISDLIFFAKYIDIYINICYNNSVG